MRSRGWIGAALTGVALACTVVPAPAQPPAADAVIIDQQWLTPRTLRLTVATDAFAAPVPVEVTLPLDYAAESARRWPVTYYLGGTAHDETTFRSYNGEAVTESYPSLVVSPRGDAGYWSDWLGAPGTFAPKYESFVTGQLIALIDATFRTVPDRAHRAIMGESMGGFGAMMLSARHPDRFAAVASLSGDVDINTPATWTVLSQSPLLQGGVGDAIYGSRADQEIRWRGHNPADLAANLAGLDLQLYTGNGVYDPAGGETQLEASLGCPVEGGIINPASRSMHTVLTDLGIAHRWMELAWGCHGVALFETEMRHAIARFEQVFTDPPPTLRSFDFRSIDPAFEIRGWSVRADPTRAVEFLELGSADADGFTLTGSGTTTITTPALAPAPALPTVTVDGQPTAVSRDEHGRLTLTVDLGPANAQQQFTPGASTPVRSAEVRILHR
ncbi:alpha/beta hydrolase [Nocardia sp. NPDC056100]|uniref:alpha/beta hydrolase n=1 Tax=Nocardia sp. NPDC056100 TaxID=3345712 RepID=UPI0035D6C94C